MARNIKKASPRPTLASNTSKPAKYRRRGNVLILIVAIVLGIIVLLVLFALGYVRLLGTGSEQKTAIEAAAIAAARDISNIVIDTDTFGFVGLSDSAPNGAATTAGDNFCTPVHSINTLIGTARIDYLIASQPGLDMPVWRQLASQDLSDAKDAATQLIAAINAAIQPGGSGKDKNGQKLTPYVSAEAAYKQNQIRMTGSSNYVNGSMKLSLGAIAGGTTTNVPVPQPLSADSTLNSTNTSNGYYKSYIDVPIADQDYVFAGIGSSIKLVDWKKWVPAVPGLPYQFPTILRAEAQQIVHNATAADQTIISVACAQPASVYDPRPAPGALTISFPDGMPNYDQVLSMPLDLYGNVLSDPSRDTSDFYDASPGDYPVSGGSQISPGTDWPITSDPLKLAASGCKLAVYDWIRRAGTRANIDSVVGMHYTPFLPQGPDVPWPPPPNVPAGNIPRGIVHIYKFDTDGIIDYEGREIKPAPWWVISDRQNLIECYDAITDGAKPFTVQPVPLTIVPPVTIPAGQVEFTPRYDMFIRFYSRKYGPPGGQHFGEPMDNDMVSCLDQDIPPEAMLKLDPDGLHGKATTSFRISDRGAKSKSPPLIGAGIGAIPTLMPQDDFAFKWALVSIGGPQVDSNPALYRKFYNGTGLRQTYMTNGSVTDIRFRRVVIGKDPVSTVVNLLGTVLPIQKQQGYVGQK